MINLEDYAQYADGETIEELRLLASSLKNLKVLHINSTREGGGVAEILSRLVPLMNALGIETHWEVFKGSEEFFRFTKKLHNMLHLPGFSRIESHEVATYLRTTYENLNSIKTETYHVVFIHDPQPMGMVINKQKHQKWVWRCHIDTSTPDPKAWDFIELFVNAYDATVFHIPEFVYQKLQVPAYIIPPSIDPLHPKNIELDRDFILQTLEKFGIDPQRPILLQVSRFDRLKDPIGVYQAYRMVKSKYACQLILAGSYASDDPEGEEVYREMLNATADDRDVFVLNLPPNSHLEINALQRASTVVLQKSIREGFGLVVSEAMWKQKPVIGGNVGGIKRQIIEGTTGFLVNTIEGTAYRARQLLSDRELRERMGFYARNRVKHRFLIIRHLKDYLVLLKSLLR
ncbi:glycosyl transferase group 1 [Hydrogenobacter thermophilus TK-6]|uniref:Glycosyltransferase n=1 Tax=Hydrogenobacter thermophilus (strain DSM 6534 / IAM 12695 / TK-6) TaxID=608538 RepID=D3DHB8_HYDTT|nr:glycosyltransferase [Hydrogenobacter thermophilus]ADO45158.1 glycosyl transferase group 1 [Hydrogenobacter thermophilus TK-6]BAI69220.1 glycosyltransferase [Hydrogenobacter thermophilus TK-6]